MKQLLFLALIFLPFQAFAFNFSGESGFYLVQIKKKYKRQVGYEKWKGKKSGYYYRINFGHKFLISPSSKLSISATSGSTKAPFLNALTSDEDKLFNGRGRTFNIENLYFEKEGFIWKNLDLKVGKFEFRIPGILRDYLWGGSFKYHFKELSIYWNQIAGYEGKYLLYSGDEDDVDIANFGINWKDFDLGFYRIMDAKGNRSAKEKTGVYGTYSNDFLSISLFTQNGKKGFHGKLKENQFSVEMGYSQKGLTSYGYSEDVKDIGLLLKPDFSGIRFGKISYSPFSFLNLYALRVEKYSGGLISSEFGTEVDYPFWKGEFFIRGAFGTENSYGVFGGYRWGVKIPKKSFPFSYNCSVKNYLKFSGEYADLPQKNYSPQLDFDGWGKAEHVGYWHTTYKLDLNYKNFELKVSTGRNSKVDYVVWGNTADNFKYQKNHGKLWHFEELKYSEKRIVAGIQDFRINGFVNDFLPGLSVSFDNLKLGAFYHEDRGDFGVYSLNYRGLSYALVSNGYRSNSLLSFFVKRWGASLSVAKEWGKRQDGEWGVNLSYRENLFKNSVLLSYRVYSDKFSTYGMREFFRDDGLIVRPGENNLRYLKVRIERPIDYKFSPKIGLIYDRLYRFSGSYVFQEFGLSVAFNPCKNGTFKLVGALGSNSSYYEGISFELNW
jgi:hypothetical protein